MTTTTDRKYANLALVRGGLYGRGRRRTPEQLLDGTIAERVAAIRGANGKVPSRACYLIAEGVNHPARYIARRIRELAKARVDVQTIVAALIQPQIEYAERITGDAA